MSTNPYTLEGTEVRSVVWGSRDLEYRIAVAVPLGPPPSGGFPVIYLLDANAMFGTMTEALRVRGPRTPATNVAPAIVVGVGYPTALPYDPVRRTWDYTWGPADTAGLPSGVESDPRGVGGASAFTELLLGNLRSEIEQQYPVDPERRTLFAHSLAGYFALRTMFTGQGGFCNYLIVSPSIWWDRAMIMNDAGRWVEERKKAGGPGCGILLAVGEYEQTVAPWQKGDPALGSNLSRRAARQMVDDARRLGARLASLGEYGHRVAFHEFPEEDHASVVFPAINRGLRFALAPR